jgi:hypothetical protein
MGKSPARKPVDRDTLTAIEAQKINLGRPARTTFDLGGDPRHMLRQFHANHPFTPIIQAPKYSGCVRFDNTDTVQIPIPSNALAVWFTHNGGSGFVITVSFDMLQGDFAAMPANTVVEGIIGNPPPDLGYWCYGSKTIYARGVNNGFLSYNFFITDDAGLGDQPQLGI